MLPFEMLNYIDGCYELCGHFVFTLILFVPYVIDYYQTALICNTHSHSVV